ncbi:unnamed protein product, partial [marine sediment metagenome]
MSVIRRAAVHRVYLIRLGFQHLAKITVSPCFREIVIRLLGIHIINIAQGDNPGIRLLTYAAQLVMPDAAHTDSRNL